MEKYSVDIHQRTFDFALRIIDLSKTLDQMPGTGWTLSKQVLRAGTSVGANVEEAQAAQSKADFINKINIALKEAREVHYWLRLLIASGLVGDSAKEMLNEADQLKRILGAITVSAKENQKN